MVCPRAVALRGLKHRSLQIFVVTRQNQGNYTLLALCFLFLYVIFFLPLDLSYVNWVSQECCLFYLRS